MDTWRFLSIVWRRLWLILLLTVAAGATAYAVSTWLPKQYQSEARVLVGSLTEPSIDQLQAHQQLAQTYAEVAMTTPVLERVIQQLQLAQDPEQLAMQLVVRAPLGDSIVRVIATGASPNEASQLANAMVDEIVQFGVPSDDQQPSLASVIQPAVPPNEPSSPRIFLNTLIAAALGLFLGVGLALLWASRPTTPWSSPEIAQPAVVAGPAAAPAPERLPMAQRGPSGFGGQQSRTLESPQGKRARRWGR